MRGLPSIVALSALVAGCGNASTADERQLAADGTEAMTSLQQSTNVASVVFDAVTQLDPVAAAAELAAREATFWPAGCASRAEDPSDPRVAHVTFRDCTGPFALVHLDGDESVTFSAGPAGTLHAALMGVSLTANGHPITYSAEADIAIEGASRRVVWQGTWTRVDAEGRTVAHASDLNIDVDTAAGCRTANGSAKTMVGGREIDTTVSDYEVCRNPDGEEACPSGTVTHTGKRSGASVTIDFDSSDVAVVTGPLGHTFALTLACPAAEISSAM